MNNVFIGFAATAFPTPPGIFSEQGFSGPEPHINERRAKKKPYHHFLIHIFERIIVDVGITN